jgi:hypothetical protein
MDEDPRRAESLEVAEVQADRPSLIRRWWSRVEPWRRMMLGGAVILLIAAAGRAKYGDSFPDSALFAANVGGYLLLALGFAQFFRDRRKK